MKEIRPKQCLNNVKVIILTLSSYNANSRVVENTYKSIRCRIKVINKDSANIRNHQTAGRE